MIQSQLQWGQNNGMPILQKSLSRSQGDPHRRYILYVIVISIAFKTSLFTQEDTYMPTHLFDLTVYAYMIYTYTFSVVRYVQVDAIKTQLEMGNVVLLSNLTYSAAGEILCCNIYDVATHAAIELGAEKLICLTQQASYLHSYKEFKSIHSSLCLEFLVSIPQISHSIIQKNTKATI